MMSSFDRSPEVLARATAFVPEGGAGEVDLDAEDFELVEWFASSGSRGGLVGATETRWPDASELAAEAYAQGRAHGSAELPWREAERFECAALALERALEELVLLRRTYLMRERGALVELAIAIAEKLVRRRVEVDPESLARVVEAALESFQVGDALTLQLSSEDREVLGRAEEGGLAARFEDYALCIEADSTLARGDVRVIAKDGEVDARLNSLLDRIREALQPLLTSEESTA